MRASAVTEPRQVEALIEKCDVRPDEDRLRELLRQSGLTSIYEQHRNFDEFATWDFDPYLPYDTGKGELLPGGVLDFWNDIPGAAAAAIPMEVDGPLSRLRTYRCTCNRIPQI